MAASTTQGVGMAYLGYRTVRGVGFEHYRDKLWHRRWTGHCRASVLAYHCCGAVAGRWDQKECPGV
jgi:hypothetical protein